MYSSAYLWSLIGRIGPQIIFLIANIILAHFLTPEELGAVGVLSILSTIASTLVDSGFGGSLINEREINDIDCSTVGFFNIFVGFFLFFVSFLCSDLIEDYFQYEGLSNVNRWLSLIFFINSFAVVPRSLLMREIRFSVLAKISLISMFVASFVSIILGMCEFGSYALVAHQIIYSLVEVTLIYGFSRYRIIFTFSWSSFVRLYPFGFFTTITNVIDAVYENIISVLLGRYLGMGSAGLFSQSKKLQGAVSGSIGQTVNSVAFPVLARSLDDKVSFHAEIEDLAKKISILIFPILGVIAVYSQEILLFLFGDQWIAGDVYLRVLILAGVFNVLETLHRNSLKALSLVRVTAIATVFKRVLGLILIVIGMFFSQGLMLAGYFLGAILGYLINLFVYGKNMGISLSRNMMRELRSLFPGLCFLTIIFFVHMVNSDVISYILNVILLLCYYLFFVPKLLRIKMHSLLGLLK